MRYLLPPYTLTFPRIALLIGLVIVLAQMLQFSADCYDEVVQETASPDKSYSALSVVRDCGATTDWSTHVTISCRSSECAHQTGEFLVLSGMPTLEIHWGSTRDLNVTYDGPVRHVYVKTLKENYFNIRVEERN